MYGEEGVGDEVVEFECIVGDGCGDDLFWNYWGKIYGFVFVGWGIGGGWYLDVFC